MINDIIQIGENYYTSIRLNGKQIRSKCLQMFLDKHICIFKPRCIDLRYNCGEQVKNQTKNLVPICSANFCLPICWTGFSLFEKKKTKVNKRVNNTYRTVGFKTTNFWKFSKPFWKDKTSIIVKVEHTHTAQNWQTKVKCSRNEL